MSSSTVDRRLGLTGGTAIKAPCACATTGNITLSGEQTIDSVTTSASRVLVKNQTTTTENGIYVSDTGAWTRDLDSDGNNDWTKGTLVFVTAGSANGSGLFQQTTAAPITIGTTSLSFTLIATLAASSVTQTNVQNGQFIEVGSIAGTNTITGTTVGTAPSALGHGQYVFFVPANTNTGATTFNRDSIGGVNVFYNGAALIGGELQASVPVLLFHDGTQYNIVASAHQNANYQTEGSVTAAATLNLDTAKPYSQITGSTGITAITLGNGRMRFVEFASTPAITNGASLVLPGAANITAAAGDTALFVGEAAGVVRCLFYTSAAQAPIQTTGSWTPVLTFATPGDLNVVYTTQVGSYTKIGRIVTLHCNIVTSTFTFSTASGTCRVTGLPYTSRTLTGASWSGPLEWRGITKANYTQWNANIVSNATIVTFDGFGSGQSPANLSTGDMPSGGTVVINFVIIYESA